jgi:hypothetical protein
MLVVKFTPLGPDEIETMKKKGLAATPLFRHRNRA